MFSVVLLSLIGTPQVERNSHIENNVPSQAVFDQLLRRDLVEYFRNLTEDEVSVDFEMLREGPTQSGTAYPKFYVWASVKRDASPSERHAVRVAAIERQRFEVTDVLSEVAITQEPSAIYEIFPAAVCKEIEAKLQNVHK